MSVMVAGLDSLTVSRRVKRQAGSKQRRRRKLTGVLMPAQFAALRLNSRVFERLKRGETVVLAMDLSRFAVRNSQTMDVCKVCAFILDHDASRVVIQMEKARE